MINDKRQTPNYDGRFTPEQQQSLLELLWAYLGDDDEHPTERVNTGWGTKTQAGLLASIEAIVDRTSTMTGRG